MAVTCSRVEKYIFEMSGLLAPLIGDTKTTQRNQTRNCLKYPCQKLSEQTSNDLKEILTSFTHVTYFFRKSISFFKIKPMLLYLGGCYFNIYVP